MPADAQHYTVAEAAILTDLSEHTLRYYERAELLVPVTRAGAGRHRRYSAGDMQTLIFIRRMRATGMPIHVLKRYMELLRAGDATLEARRQILEDHQTTVTIHLAELRECLDIIAYKLANYDELMRRAPRQEAGPQPKLEKESDTDDNN